MDIAKLSPGLAQSNIMNDLGVAMLSKSMDLAQTEGALLAESIASMPSGSLESLVNPATMGTHIDMTV